MESKASACPICSSRNLVPTVTRDHLPAMQNRVFRTLNDALSAGLGRLTLSVCADCGFGFNSDFDGNLLNYDQNYDNTVASAVQGQYYAEIARHLNDRYLGNAGIVLDIGCGKGTFLKTLCRLFPGVKGLGIDPSYEGPEQDPDLPLRFIRDFFNESNVSERPTLVVCRHVLEHIERPIAFLKSIQASLRAFPDVPVFFEVPDLGWILQNRVFWDFCYEHCNYFTAESLSHAVERSGYRPVRSQTAFGSQYLWIEARSGSSCSPGTNGNSQTVIQSALDYAASETRQIESIRSRFLNARREGAKIVIWGMATKGVLFSCLIDPDRTLFDFCIDANPNKSSCYVPTTGHCIQPPAALDASRDHELIVVVMNPNYLDEIKAACAGRGLTASFTSANGDRL